MAGAGGRPGTHRSLRMRIAPGGTDYDAPRRVSGDVAQGTVAELTRTSRWPQRPQLI